MKISVSFTLCGIFIYWSICLFAFPFFWKMSESFYCFHFFSVHVLMIILLRCTFKERHKANSFCRRLRHIIYWHNSVSNLINYFFIVHRQHKKKKEKGWDEQHKDRLNHGNVELPCWLNTSHLITSLSFN